jgi:two-component system, OmpR family, sensor kinase
MRQFIADVSHELRTPLTSVQGLAEYSLQLGTTASQEGLLRLMSLVAHEAGRMGRLVEDLLLLARFDARRPLERALVDLASVAAEAVQAARAVYPDRRITLLADEPVIVLADYERVRQVTDNLMSNAFKHISEGSQVTIAVTSADGSGQLAVADAGPGMTQEQAARVFERFYRIDDARDRARGGTGLGLAIAASLAAAHSGELTVDTAPGQGATFYVRIPLATGKRLTRDPGFQCFPSYC